MTETSRGEDRQGKFLAISILAVLVLPLVYWQIAGFANVQDWKKGIWGLFASAVFFSAYFFRTQTSLFRGILWFLRRIHIPPGEWFALVYGTLFLAIALFYFGSEMEVLDY